MSKSSTLKICSPGNLQGRRTSSTVAILTWDEPYSTCHLCPDAVGYEISGEGIATVNILRPPYELRGLNRNINYRVCVRAKAAGNNISEPSYFDVLKSPGTPGNLRATHLPDEGVTLTWSAPLGDVPVFDYLVSRHGELIATVRGLTYQVSDSTALTAYDIEVRARSARSNLSDPALLDITPPGRPIGLFAVSMSSRAVALIWGRSNDNVRVASYEILKDDEVIDTTQNDTPAYLAIGLTPETQYRFAVRALDESGNRSKASDPLYVKTPLLDPPKNVRILNVTPFSIALAWDRPDGAIGLISYNSQADNHSGSFREIQTPLQGVTFIGLRPSSTYTVSIRSQDASERYSQPVTLEITTPQITQTTPLRY